MILPSSYNKFPCDKYITTWLYSCSSRLKPFDDSWRVSIPHNHLAGSWIDILQRSGMFKIHAYIILQIIFSTVSSTLSGITYNKFLPQRGSQKFYVVCDSSKYYVRSQFLQKGRVRWDLKFSLLSLKGIKYCLLWPIFFFFNLGIKQDHEFPPSGHSLRGKAA